MLVTGSGTINTAGLSSTGVSGAITSAEITPSTAFLSLGAAGNTFYIYTGFTGPDNFGPGSTPTAASASAGDVVGLLGSSESSFATPILLLPTGYVSNSLLTNSATFAGTTFDSLGLTPGTYMYSFGTGDFADTLTVNVVPEPSTSALALVGAGLVGLMLRRQARA